MGITELCVYLPLCLCFVVLCFVTWNNFLMTSIEIWLKQIEQELKGRLPEKLPQDEIHLNPSTPERSGLMQGSNPRSRDQPTGNDYGDSLSSLIVHPDSQSISDGHYRYPSNGAKGQQYGSNIGINGPLKFREQQNGDILETSRYMYNLPIDVPYIGIDGLLKSREQHNGGILQTSLETARYIFTISPMNCITIFSPWNHNSLL